MEEKDIIAEIRENGAAALGKVYSDHRSAFVNWVVSKHGVDLDDAKEIYQVVVVTFYENIVSGKLTELTSSIKTYLFSIGYNKVREQWKTKQRYADQPDFEMLNIFDHEDQDKGDWENSIRFMSECMETLGDPCKQLLEEYYYNRKSMDVIKSEMGYKTTDAVKTKKYKCLNRLRNIFFQGRLNKVES